MTELTISTNFFIGVGSGLFVGLIVGYILGLRVKSPEKALTASQVLAMLALAGYILASFAFQKEPNWLIAIGILASGYGTAGGVILEKILERSRK